MADSTSTVVLRGLMRALSWLPLPALHGLGWLLGTLAAYLPLDVRRDTEVNLRLCFPDWNARARRRLLKQALRESAKGMLEMTAFWYWSPQRLDGLVREAEGEELLLDAAAAGRGVMVAVPHLGAWELLGLRFSQRVPLHMMYRPPRQPALDPLLRTARGRFGGRSHPATPAGIRQIYKALVQGEVVAILPDQEPRGEGVYAPFFGVDAKTMTLLPKLARRAEVPVLLGYAIRLPWGRGYRVRFRPAPAAVADRDLETATAALNAAIETCAHEALPQYQWTYRRFRRYRPGPNPYRRTRRRRRA